MAAKAARAPSDKIRMLETNIFGKEKLLKKDAAGLFGQKGSALTLLREGIKDPFLRQIEVESYRGLSGLGKRTLLAKALDIPGQSTSVYESIASEFTSIFRKQFEDIEANDDSAMILNKLQDLKSSYGVYARKLGRVLGEDKLPTHFKLLGG